MSLDTATARRSMIAIPGIGTLPVPNLMIDNPDRRHIVDVFAGFSSRIETFFFWRKHAVPASTWVPEKVSASPPFLAGNKPSSRWVPDQDHAEE